MSNSIILFRFYKHFQICKERVKIIKHFNPNLPIYGVFGGKHGDFQKAKNTFKDDLFDIQMATSTDPEWKWLHPDLALKEWFRNLGHKVNFDFLYDYEWDLLTLASLEEIYPKIDQNSIALSGREVLEAVKDRWDWTSQEPWRSNYLEFREYMRRNYGLERQQFASLGPGPLLSRKFIEDFCAAEDTDLVVSEISYPAFAQALGYKIVDTQLHPRWFNQEAERFFNCLNIEIPFETIKAEVQVKHGRRAFHPVKKKITLLDIIKQS